MLKLKETIYIFICILVTLPMTLSFLLIENSLPLYESSFVLLLLWYVLMLNNILKLKGKKEKYFFIAIICASLFLIMDVLISFSGRIPIEPLTLIMNFVLLHIIIQCSISEKILRWFLVIGMIGANLFAIAYFTNAKIWGYSTSITIGNSNPQAIGLWAFIFLCVVVLSFDYFEWPLILKISLLFLIAYLFVIAIETETRTAIICDVLFLILRILPQIEFLKKDYIAKFFSLIPAVIAVIAIGISLLGKFSGYLGGSLFNGRENSWIYYLEQGFSNPFLGNYDELQGYYFHNIFVHQVAMYGIIVAILFIIVMSFALKKTVTLIENRIQYDGYTAFLSMLIASALEEEIFIVGGGGMFFYAYSFLLIANGNFDVYKKHSNKIKFKI